MKKMTRTITILMFYTSTYAQDVIIDSCGIDDSPKLNQYEIGYFQNALNSNHIENVETLIDKRILFLSGNYGLYAKTKGEFFEQYGKPWFQENDYPQMQIIILNFEEKLELDNYDVIIVSWSKIPVSGRNKKKFINNAKMNVHNTQ